MSVYVLCVSAVVYVYVGCVCLVCGVCCVCMCVFVCGCIHVCSMVTSMQDYHFFQHGHFHHIIEVQYMCMNICTFIVLL